MAAGKPPRWERIQAEYVKGGISYRELAAKHGVSLDTLEKRARREGWGDQLRQAGEKVAAELPAVVAAVQLDEAERTTREDLEVLGEAVRQARALLCVVTDAQQFKDWAAGFKLVQASRRLALGLDAGDGKGGVSAAGPAAPRPPVDDLLALGVDALRRRLEGEIGGADGR